MTYQEEKMSGPCTVNDPRGQLANLTERLDRLERTVERIYNAVLYLQADDHPDWRKIAIGDQEAQKASYLRGQADGLEQRPPESPSEFYLRGFNEATLEREERTRSMAEALAAADRARAERYV